MFYKNTSLLRGTHFFWLSLLNFMRYVQHQKVSQAQSNSKQEQITTQVSTENSLPLLTAMLQRRKRMNFSGFRTSQVASIGETVRVLDLELRKHCEENKMEKDKDEMDKKQISASFLEVR